MSGDESILKLHRWRAGDCFILDIIYDKGQFQGMAGQASIGSELDQRLRLLEVSVQNGTEIVSFTAQNNRAIWMPIRRPENRNDELPAVPQ